MTVSSDRRHRRRNPCPICGGFDELERGQGKRCSGFTGADGEYAHCSREELAGSIAPGKDGLYAHLLKGPCNCGQEHKPDYSAARSAPRGRSKLPPIEKLYDYTDESGNLLFQVVRFVGKDFRQRHPDGNGGWIWKLNGVRRVPYAFTELLAATGDKPICIVEGEKDADRLRSLGAVATCNPMGAGKWKAVAEDVRRIIAKGHDVVIIADADDTGRAHAREVADSLKDVAKSVVVLEPPPPYKDVSEMLDGGGKYADLVPLSGGWVPPPPSSGGSMKPPPPEPPGRGDAEGITADLTDMRNAERLVEWHGPKLRYVGKWGKWLAWDGKRWCMDDLGRVHECAKNVARRLLAEAKRDTKSAWKKLEEARAADDKDKEDKAKIAVKLAAEAVAHSRKSQNSGKLSAMVDVACSDKTIAVKHDLLDVDRMLLNVDNGIIDLERGVLLPHDQNRLMTRLAPIAYDPSAACPIWDKFLLRSMGNNQDLVSFLQRAVGYSLTGLVTEHVLFFLHGNGANGKSTFLNIIQALLGDYAGPSAPGLIFRKGREDHLTVIADLYGMRLVTSSESQEGGAFDEALMKMLTGGDKIKARRMQEDPWQFDPSHKFWLAGNHKPTVRGDDEGVWRRIKLIPFTVTIPEAERDQRLGEKLLAELPGILVWAVRGCQEWLRMGLSAPGTVKAATADYRSENDLLGQFFREHLVFERDKLIPRAKVRETYEKWCREMGSEPVGPKRLATRLRERASDANVELRDTTMRIESFGTTSVVNAWKGLRLLTDDERQKRTDDADRAAREATPNHAN